MTAQGARHLGVSRESNVSIRVVQGLLEIVEMSGVPRAQFLGAAQLDADALAVDDKRITRSEAYRLCEVAIDLTGDPALGLHWAERLSSNTFTPISHLIAHAATLRQAFEALSLFIRLVSDEPSYTLDESHDRVIVRCVGMPGESIRVQRFAEEMLVTGIFRMLRSFNLRARPERVSFEYPAPSYRADYTRVFEGTERFSQPFTGLVFDRALMNATSLHKDDDVHGALWSVAQRRVLRLTQRTPYSIRVRDQLVQQGPGCPTEMENVAASLGLSVRSLRRRLAAEGKTYNAVANDALAIIAKHLLRDKQHTIQEVAYEMGFSDTSTFHRAFKRWTGMTPRSYRDAVPEASAEAASVL